jgi:hypothetical protein
VCREWYPLADERPYVELLSHQGNVQRHVVAGESWRVVPDPCAHLMFIAWGTAGGGWTRAPMLCLVGARSRYVDVDKAGRTMMLAIRLRPGVLGSLIGNNQGWAQAEILFHETSHLLIHPVEQALYVAGRDLHRSVPRVLWHVVLFFTAGELTKQVLARRDVAYEPYLYKTGLFDRAWPTYRPAIETVLPDFVAGKKTREDMAHALVRALPDGDTPSP